MALPHGDVGGLRVLAGRPAARGAPGARHALVMISRRRAGLPLLTGGRDHLTHRLASRLGSPRQVALTLGAAPGGARRCGYRRGALGQGSSRRRLVDLVRCRHLGRRAARERGLGAGARRRGRPAAPRRRENRDGAGRASWRAARSRSSVRLRPEPLLLRLLRRLGVGADRALAFSRRCWAGDRASRRPATVGRSSRWAAWSRFGCGRCCPPHGRSPPTRQ